jgi:secretion/DNA translocation related TadE-like protein
MSGGGLVANCPPRAGPADEVADHRDSDADRGAATVWTAGAIAALAVVFGLALHLGSAVIIRHRTTAAADLAALAAASHAVAGEQHACGRAGWVVDRMGGRLVRCRLVAWDAVVEVESRAAGLGRATAHARAGPVSR